MMTGKISENLQLQARTALPEGFAFLLEAFPRETWEGHPNNGQWCQFWLARHMMFRDFGTALTDACEKLDAEQVDAPTFHDWFMPRASFFLGELDTHHKVEEYHYFPILGRAEPRMVRGVELLEADHYVIHDALRSTYDAIVALEVAIREDGGDVVELVPRLLDELALLDTILCRHLDDEEDLIVPLILDRSEAGLGVH